MSRKDDPIYFDPSRFDLDSDGEVSVGAYARRQWRRQIAIGAIGAAMITAAIVIYISIKPESSVGPAGYYEIKAQCQSCGYRVKQTVPFNQTFPMKCPSCGEIAVQPVWQCQDCNHSFVPESRGTDIRCPNCGSERVGSAAVP